MFHILQLRALLLIQLLVFHSTFGQIVNPWKVPPDTMDPDKYYGVTLANGMVGLGSSPEPFHASNFIAGFNSMQLDVAIDGKKVTSSAGLSQQLDMRHASLDGSVALEKGVIEYKYYALRHLPYNLLLDVTITA